MQQNAVFLFSSNLQRQVAGSMGRHSLGGESRVVLQAWQVAKRGWAGKVFAACSWGGEHHGGENKPTVQI